MKFSKNFNNKKRAPKLIFFNEKKIEKESDNFWQRKLTLKVRNWLFSIAWFRADVDLTKFFSYGRVLNYSTIWCRSWWKILKCYLIHTSSWRALLLLPLDIQLCLVEGGLADAQILCKLCWFSLFGYNIKALTVWGA